MRSGPEEHSAIHSRIVQSGEVAFDRVVDMTVGIDDQRFLQERAGRWNAAGQAHCCSLTLLEGQAREERRCSSENWPSGPEPANASCAITNGRGCSGPSAGPTGTGPMT